MFLRNNFAIKSLPISRLISRNLYYVNLSNNTFNTEWDSKDQNFSSTTDKLTGWRCQTIFYLVSQINLQISKTTFDLCRQWRSFYISNSSRAKCVSTHQLPFLMLHDDQDHCRKLYSIFHKRVLQNFKLPDVLSDFICWGSTQGWLVISNQDLSNFRLLNPFLLADNEIELPSLTYEGNEAYLNKTVLSANPALQTTYMVMVIYGDPGKLAFYKPGDRAWTPIDTTFDREYGPIEDVIYYKEQFHAVSSLGWIYSVDVNSSHTRRLRDEPISRYSNSSVKNYLVDSSGDLLVVTRLMLGTDDTVGFEVLKMDAITHQLAKVNSLGDVALFLAHNSSISVKPSMFPGCNPNCIYFTYEVDDQDPDEDSEEPYTYDMGVFNLETRTIEFETFLMDDSIYLPRLWIEPTLPRCCFDH